MQIWKIHQNDIIDSAMPPFYIKPWQFNFKIYSTKAHSQFSSMWDTNIVIGLIHKTTFSLPCACRWLSHVLDIYVSTAMPVTRWGRLTHICVGTLTIIDSDNGLTAPWRRQAIMWINARIQSLKFQHFTKERLKMPSEICCQFHLRLNVLNENYVNDPELLVKRNSRTSQLYDTEYDELFNMKVWIPSHAA